MVPFNARCGSVVLAAIIIFAPSAEIFLAIANPIPRLAPVMKTVFPFKALKKTATK